MLFCLQSHIINSSLFVVDQIIEKATIAAVRSVLPMAARLGRKRKSSEQADLRDIISGRGRQSSERYTLFVGNACTLNYLNILAVYGMRFLAL